jgi:hypothetical protein
MTYYYETIQKQIDKARTRAKEKGWEFKERSPEHNATIGDFINAVLEIHNPTDALKFYESYVEHLGKVLDPLQYNAEDVAKKNIGWVFGEGMSQELKDMWIILCGATHPVFGQEKHSSFEVFKMGLEMGRKIKH